MNLHRSVALCFTLITTTLLPQTSSANPNKYSANAAAANYYVCVNGAITLGGIDIARRKGVAIAPTDLVYAAILACAKQKTSAVKGVVRQFKEAGLLISAEVVSREIDEQFLNPFLKTAKTVHKTSKKIAKQ